MNGPTKSVKIAYAENRGDEHCRVCYTDYNLLRMQLIGYAKGDFIEIAELR